jgi:hypothetical protein
MVSIDRTGPRIVRGTALRLLSPLSDLWDGAFRSPAAIYKVREGIPFYACHFDEDRHQLEFYSDFDDLAVEEVQLLSSMALTVGLADGLRFVYPDPAVIVVPEFIPLDSDEGEDAIWNLLSEYLREPQRRGLADPPLPQRNGNSGSGTTLRPELQRLIFDRIDLSNHALLRGLGTWTKAGMLWMHRSFAEEANYALYVSLDASFTVVRALLKANGNPDPSAYDAGHFIQTAFGEEATGIRYFEDFYEDRIRTMHPESRLGTFVYAPLGRDDFYWLWRDLREVWRLLIVGQVITPPPLPITWGQGG